MATPIDPIDALAETLLPILFGTAQARPSGRLRPLMVGRPHPRRRLMRWGSQITITQCRRLACPLAAMGSL
jgi:hypothetical protein